MTTLDKIKDKKVHDLTVQEHLDFAAEAGRLAAASALEVLLTPQTRDFIVGLASDPKVEKLIIDLASKGFFS